MKLFHLTLLINLISIRHVAGRLKLDKNEWIPVAPNLEFQRNDDAQALLNKDLLNHATNEAINRILSNSKSTSKAEDMTTEINPFYTYQPIDSGASYSEYQLAWYLLGYYIDCGTQNSYGSGCVRQALYAVYAYPEYEGGGIGEFSYYDKTTEEWKCYSGNCKAKMDCHLSDTKWKLIGVFKISNLSGNNGFLDLLLKHQGACLWDDDEYKIVYKMKYTNPEGCKSTKKTLADGTTLYYGAKPQASGSISLGLYIDNMCSIEYAGKTSYDVYSLVGSDKSYWVSFNEALDAFKQCQPCVSYDLSSSDFECYDKAGYTNVNQCMKFSAKAGCKPATTSDTTLAARQNTLVSFQWLGQDLESNVIKSQKSANVNGRSSLLVSSLLFCALGMAAFVHTTNMKLSRKTGDMSVTLMDGNPDDNTRVFDQNISGKNKKIIPNTANESVSHAYSTTIPPPPADNQSVKTGKSHNSTARSKVGSGILKKLSAALSFKDSVSEKVNLEVKYVEKSVGSQYKPPGPKLNENTENDTKIQVGDHLADQSNSDSSTNAAQLNSKSSEHDLLPLGDCSMTPQSAVVRQTDMEGESQNPAVHTGTLSGDITTEHQTLDLLSAKAHDASTESSKIESSCAENPSPMPQGLHTSDTHGTPLQPSTDKVLPSKEAEMLQPKQESSDARSGQTSKKSNSLKQYLKRIKP